MYLAKKFPMLLLPLSLTYYQHHGRQPPHTHENYEAWAKKSGPHAVIGTMVGIQLGMFAFCFRVLAFLPIPLSAHAYPEKQQVVAAWGTAADMGDPHAMPSS